MIQNSVYPGLQRSMSSQCGATLGHNAKQIRRKDIDESATSRSAAIFLFTHVVPQCLFRAPVRDVATRQPGAVGILSLFCCAVFNATRPLRSAGGRLFIMFSYGSGKPKTLYKFLWYFSCFPMFSSSIGITIPLIFHAKSSGTFLSVS